MEASVPPSVTSRLLLSVLQLTQAEKDAAYADWDQSSFLDFETACPDWKAVEVSWMEETLGPEQDWDPALYADGDIASRTEASYDVAWNVVWHDRHNNGGLWDQEGYFMHEACAFILSDRWLEHYQHAYQRRVVTTWLSSRVNPKSGTLLSARGLTGPIAGCWGHQFKLLPGAEWCLHRPDRVRKSQKLSWEASATTWRAQGAEVSLVHGTAMALVLPYLPASALGRLEQCATSISILLRSRSMSWLWKQRCKEEGWAKPLLSSSSIKTDDLDNCLERNRTDWRHVFVCDNSRNRRRIEALCTAMLEGTHRNPRFLLRDQPYADEDWARDWPRLTETSIRQERS
ncbi:hypothetical protein HKX48_003651 [Thoreauomyces humboldtii]|nr:hypothetical protein HKX48_003651 [Thoreauomyces humboldtii]